MLFRSEKFKNVPRRQNSYGSIIAVVATDAPLLNHQLNRLCKRVGLGIARVGSYAAHGSGEIVVGFSTANIIPRRTQKMVYKLKILLDQRLDPLYEAVMEATEEAILNALCMATSMTGVNGNFVPALPLDEVRRFVAASRPLFTPSRKRSHPAAPPAEGDKGAGDKAAADTAPKVRLSESSFPQPTRPAPGDSEDSSSGGTSGT